VQPTVQKRVLSVVLAALVSLLAAGPAQAGKSPKIKAAYPVDTDRDGHVDAVSLKWSKKVRAKSDTTAPFAVKVRGYRVTSVGAARGKKQTVEVAERPECDTGGSVKLSFRPRKGAAKVTLRRGKKGARKHRLDMRRFDVPTPRITCAVTLDSDADGRVDGVRVTYSRDVRSKAQKRGRFLFSVAGYQVQRVQAARGRFLKIDVAELASPDSGATPAIGYSRPSKKKLRRFSIRAGRRENAFPGSYRSTRDGVSPRLVSGETGDADRDGLLDAMTLRFSEPVTVRRTEALAVLGMQVRPRAQVNGANVTLSLVENTARGDARPGAWVEGNGVTDLSGNDALAGSVAPADKAPPVVTAAVTQDTGGSPGHIDAVLVRFSEPVAHPRDAGGAYPFLLAGRNVTSVEPADGFFVQVRVAEAGQPDTGDRPSVRYIPGAGLPIADRAGNDAAEGLTSSADGVAPVLLSAETTDADADGELDSVAVKFSESVVHAQEAAPGSFTAGTFAIMSAEAAAGDTVELQLQQSGTGDTGVRPAVSYTPDGTEDVRDAAGNFAPSGSVLQATDGARPVLLSAATADVDDDGTLDRVTTGWSEPLVHANDTASPFPLSAETFTVARVHAAAGQTLDVDLTEPAAPDTGSAPDLTYTGGPGPITDAAGLEPTKTAHSGLTRDALAPRRVSVATVDDDVDGKVDAIDIEWSETLTGPTGSAPFTVAGRTLGANVSFNGATTRVPFAEDPAQFDTGATPDVSYDAGVGDLRDIPEGTGDNADDAPTITAEPSVDKARPILIDAETADLEPFGDPNGTIDAVRVRFSEPVTHSVDGLAPFSLNVAGRTEWQVDDNSGDDTFAVHVNESSNPDGGDTPNVTVQAIDPPADRIRDEATVPNEALPMQFTGTADKVRPVLVSAELGERDATAACTTTADPGIDGFVDCARATWSENVQIARDDESPYSIVSDTWAIPSDPLDPDRGIQQQALAKTLVVPFDPATEADRDRSGTSISYQGGSLPVEDAAGQESLDSSVIADPACRDTGLEGNDDLDVGNPTLVTTSPSFQRKCAFDDDWYRVETTADFLEIATRPAPDVDVDFELWTDSAEVTTGMSELETGAAGKVDRRTFTGLTPSTPYYLLVKSGVVDENADPQEGPYCVVFADAPDLDPGCGPLAGQIVFTEVGFGNDKFIEIKNDFDVPVDMAGAGAELVIGPVGDTRSCTLTMPGNTVNAVIDPNEHVLVEQSSSPTSFGCNLISSLASGGERVELRASGSIDVVDFAGIFDSSAAAQHSLEFVEAEDPDADANNEVATRWCRTFAADTKGAAGDGCDEYRINEVLWRPPTPVDGKAFVELAGNIPALPQSNLLGNWMLRGVNGLSGAGEDEIVLPVDASPRDNGMYVVADGLAGGGTLVANNPDLVDGALDLASPFWTDPSGAPGPRGLQLLTPDPSGTPSSPCVNSMDAFGWLMSTGVGFSGSGRFDLDRGCPTVEGNAYAYPAGTAGPSAARESQSTDSGDNLSDFCPQTVPNPAEVNTRPGC
jgi:hypothetical protein